jgi:hypothetical protein
MDEMEFTEAQSIMTNFVSEYQEAANGGPGEGAQIRTV